MKKYTKKDVERAVAGLELNALSYADAHHRYTDDGQQAADLRALKRASLALVMSARRFVWTENEAHLAGRGDRA